MKKIIKFVIWLILWVSFGFSAGISVSAIVSPVRSLLLCLLMGLVAVLIGFVMYLLWRRGARHSAGSELPSVPDVGLDGSEVPDLQESVESEADQPKDSQVQVEDTSDENPETVTVSDMDADQSDSSSSLDGAAAQEEIRPEVPAAEKVPVPEAAPEAPVEEPMPAPEDAASSVKESSGISEYVVIDFETTGVDLRVLEVIQIGALKIKDGVVIDEFSSYVKPIYGLSAKAQEVNHITLDDVRDTPLLRDVLPDLLSFIGDDPLVGYNIAGFDAKILKRDVRRELGESLGNECIDVMAMARSGLSKQPNYKLITVCEYLDVPVVNAHDATADCRMTYQCFEILTKQMNVGYDVINISDLPEPAPIVHQSEEESTEKNRLEKIKTACDDFSVQGKLFCLSGTFQMGSKEDVSSLITSHGGIIKSSVSRKLDYLIVGSHESLMWKYGKYGTKVVRACELIENGCKIEILAEQVLSDYFKNLE